MNTFKPIRKILYDFNKPENFRILVLGLKIVFHEIAKLL